MKRWRDLPVFAPDDVPRRADRDAITEFRAWRISEPESKRQYTVIRLTAATGAVGFGEGAPATRSEIVEAKAAVMGRSASDAEYIRHRLAALPAMEAAVSNAILDISATIAGVPVYQYLGIASIHVDAAMPNFLYRRFAARCNRVNATRFGRIFLVFRQCEWLTGGIRYRKSRAWGSK